MCEDGDQVTIGDRHVDVERQAVPAGYPYVDGIVGDIGQGVLRDRRQLAEEGVVVVIVTVDQRSGEIVTGPEIVTKGWVHATEAEELLDEARGRRPPGGRRRPPSRAAPTSRRCAAAPGGPSASSSTSGPSGDPRSSPSSWRSEPRPMIRDWSNFIADRTALVTGSGGGVGRAIAIQMARAGADVWINDLYVDRAAGRRREIEAEQGRASVVVADVCDRDRGRAHGRRDRPGRHPREQRGHPGRGVHDQARSSTPVPRTGIR